MAPLLTSLFVDVQSVCSSIRGSLIHTEAHSQSTSSSGFSRLSLRVLMQLRGRHLHYSVRIWSLSLLMACSRRMLAICASLILFATFIVGLRCFGDFDKGLKPSKVHGMSLLPTQTPEKIGLIGEFSYSSPAHRRQFNTQITRVQFRGQE